MTGSMQSYRLTRFACGCVGRNNEASHKVTAFIRVVEVRGAKVDESDKKCPNHSGKVA